MSHGMGRGRGEFTGCREKAKGRGEVERVWEDEERVSGLVLSPSQEKDHKKVRGGLSSWRSRWRYHAASRCIAKQASS